MSTFYEFLRDDVAGPLIEQFGRDGIYSIWTENFDIKNGGVERAVRYDHAIKLLDLPIKDRVFSEEVTTRSNAMFLVAAEPFMNTFARRRNNMLFQEQHPRVDEVIFLDDEEYHINAINIVGPSGVPVVFKMAMRHA